MTLRITIEIAVIARLLSCASGAALADEELRPLAVSGQWVAAAHSPSMIDRADVCLLMNPSSGVAVRATTDSVQLRVINSKWTLPTGVSGNLVLTAGDWTATLAIDDNTDTMVNAKVDSDVVVPMLNAMDNASSMSVKVGKAPPIQVSLAGSMRAANAFHTCAGISGVPKGAGANPFE